MVRNSLATFASIFFKGTFFPASSMPPYYYPINGKLELTLAAAAFVARFSLFFRKLNLFSSIKVAVWWITIIYFILKIYHKAFRMYVHHQVHSKYVIICQIWHITYYPPSYKFWRAGSYIKYLLIFRVSRSLLGDL